MFIQYILRYGVVTHKITGGVLNFKIKVASQLNFSINLTFVVVLKLKTNKGD